MRRPAKGIFAVSSVCAGAAILFGDPAALLASASLAGVLAVRGGVFLYRTSSCLSSAEVTRTAGQLFARKGAEIAMEVEVKAEVPEGLSVRVSEILPAGAVHLSGRAEGRLKGEGGGVFSSRYRIRCLTDGVVRPGGMRFDLQDPLFRTGIVMSRKTECGPELRIFPLSQFEKEGSTGTGEEETNIATHLKGTGIRSFREYTTGDDLRTVDWKQSAKHGTLYVREYMGRRNAAEILVVDLPDNDADMPEGAFEQMKGACASAVMQMLNGPDVWAVLMISGPNYVAEYSAADTRGLMDIVGEMRPAGRMFHLYRSGRTPAGGEEKEHSHLKKTDAFPSAVEETSRSFAREQTPTLFERQMGRILPSFAGAEMVVCSCMQGDVSHLHILSTAAQDLALHTRLQIPLAADNPLVRKKAAECIFDHISVVT